MECGENMEEKGQYLFKVRQTYIMNVCLLYAIMTGAIDMTMNCELIMNCTDRIAITLKQSSLLLEIT